MWNYSTSISAELPDCLSTSYSKLNAVTTFRRSLVSRHYPPIYSDVSPDAPSSFHNSFIPPPKLRYHNTPSPPKFEYEDMSRLKQDQRDLSTMRPKQYFDVLLNKNQGVKSRLPYYQEYYRTLRKTGFGIREGMCTSDIRKRVSEVHRVKTHLTNLIRDSPSPETSHLRNRSESSHYSPKSDLKHSFDTPLFTAADYKVKLPTLRLRQYRKKPNLTASVEVERYKSLMVELDNFDKRQKADMLHFSLRIAISSDNVAQVRHILTSHPDFSPEDCPCGGSSPLHIACSSGALNTVRFFLKEGGCDVNCCNCQFGMSLVHVAALHSRLDVLKYLAEQHADFSLVDIHGESVLHKAAIGGDFPVLKYLLEECQLDDLLLQTNDEGLSPYEFFTDLCEKKGHPKQLTEEREYEAALRRVREYLLFTTDRKQSWARRRHFLASFFVLQQLKLV